MVAERDRSPDQAFSELRISALASKFIVDVHPWATGGARDAHPDMQIYPIYVAKTDYAVDRTFGSLPGEVKLSSYPYSKTCSRAAAASSL